MPTTPTTLGTPSTPGTQSTPGTPGVSQSTRRRWTAGEILEPLRGTIDPVLLTDTYRLGVCLVAMVMILLPLVYLALIGLLALLVVWHLVSHLQLVGQGPVGLFLYLLPAVLGGVCVLFMFKPLFAPPARRSATYSLDRNHEPLLFEFVERLCGCLGAPVPRRIDVMTDTNAAASLRNGLWSLFSDDLVLTIGLPLVGGLTLRQLAGVLAHEFGHFSQGTAMRFSWIVNRINSWLARVVYERDAWDEGLERLSGTHHLVWLLLLPVRLLVWLNRRILWCVMFVAHMVSCFLARQMEHDADRHETRIAGSEVFAQTSLDLHVLGYALKMAYENLEDSWLEKRLSDDLPALVQANVQRLRGRPQTLEKIRKAVLEEQTGLFDTHPSTAERIERARREFAPGLYQVEAPAQVLFRDFSGLCRALTLEYYREVLGPEVSPANLVPTSELVAEQQLTDDALSTLYRYFQGKVVGSVEVFLPYCALLAPESPRRTLELLKHSRGQMLAGLQQMAEAVERFDQTDRRLRELAQISVAIEAGFGFDAQQLQLADSRPETVALARRQAELQRAEALRHLNLATGFARNRLVAALQLLHVPQVAARMPDAAGKLARTTQLLLTLQALENAWNHVLRLREIAHVLHLLVLNLEDHLRDAALLEQIHRMADRARDAIRSVRQQLAATPYPFSHATRQISIADYALRNLPDGEQLGQVLQAAEELMEKLGSLYYRVLAHLAVTAEEVESLAGMPPLAEPPEPPETDDDSDAGNPEPVR